MTRRTSNDPSYRLHKQSGQAIVTLPDDSWLSSEDEGPHLSDCNDVPLIVDGAGD